MRAAQQQAIAKQLQQSLSAAHSLMGSGGAGSGTASASASGAAAGSANAGTGSAPFGGPPIGALGSASSLSAWRYPSSLPRLPSYMRSRFHYSGAGANDDATHHGSSVGRDCVGTLSDLGPRNS